MEQKFIDQARLMLQCLPIVMDEDVFALKGGTALNFFYRDMPRLSVDIDLTYLPIKPRKESLAEITSALERIGSAIRKEIHVRVEKKRAERSILKLLIFGKDAMIKIEPNLVLRGTVYKPIKMSLCAKAQDFFETFFEATCLDEDELYAGKICAALDRQHPRDFFDINYFYQNSGFSDRLYKALIFYIASSPRPMHELLAPNKIDITQVYMSEFSGMTQNPIELQSILDIRDRLFKDIISQMPKAGANFLISLNNCSPDWSILNIADLENLPAIKWKLLNLQKMEKAKREKQLSILKTILQNKDLVF